MRWVWLAVAIVALYGVHRLALYAGARGWIYYRNNPTPSDAGGIGVMSVAQIFEPELEHVLDEIHSEKVRADQDAEGELFTWGEDSPPSR